MLISRLKKSTSGFTIVELIIVVALISLISAVALPTVSSVFKVSIHSVSRRVASLIRESFDSAVLTGYVHRLAYDIEKNEVWVERGPSSILLDSPDAEDKEARRKKLDASDDEKSKPASDFNLDPSITRKKIPLARGVEIKDVITEKSKEPLKDGIAYTHFFPNGLTEQTIVHLIDSSNHEISLVVSALIGRTKVLQGYVDKEDVFGK